MANPNRTDYEEPSLSEPGLIWINSKVTDKAILSDEAFTRWYEDIHIPDVIAAKHGGILASWRYQCANKERSAPYLAVYKVPDMGFLQSPEFKAIPMTHPTLPGNGPIHQFADFDARFMEHIKTWESKDANDGRINLLVSEATEPADFASDSFHEWYAKDYIPEVSKLPGWQRISLLKLAFKKETKDDTKANKKITPIWLAMHEFEPGSIPDHQNLTTLLGQSTIARKMAEEAKKVDVAAFEMLRGFGTVDERWADQESSSFNKETVKLKRASPRFGDPVPNEWWLHVGKAIPLAQCPRFLPRKTRERPSNRPRSPYEGHGLSSGRIGEGMLRVMAGS